MATQMKRGRVAVVALCGLLSSGGGCQKTGNQDELWALLDDAEVTGLRSGRFTVDGQGAQIPFAVDTVLAAAFPFGSFGVWHFDDCNADRTNLADSGPNGNTAFRSVGTACTP